MDEKGVALFWAKVDRRGPSECWLWTGFLNNRGYGRLTRKPRHLFAHRAAWELTYGSVPDGLWVLHRCDNPPCCNPAHLFLGTHQDNMDDMAAKGRAAAGERSGPRLHPGRLARGIRHGSKTHPESVQLGSHRPNAVLTEADIPVIRARLTRGERPAIVAADYRVAEATVRQIVRGRTWRHVA